MSPPDRPRKIRLCGIDRLMVGAATAVLTAVGSCTLAVASWTLLKVVDLGERVSNIEGRLNNLASSNHSDTPRYAGK